MCSAPSQPPIKWVPGVLSSGVKPGPQAEHSFPSSAEFKEEGGGAIFLLPLYNFMAWTEAISPSVLVKGINVDTQKLQQIKSTLMYKLSLTLSF
jgi:hypothetical protein